MFQRILVPLDGSKRAESALPVAARIARSTGAKLLLLRVVPPPTEASLDALQSVLSLEKVPGTGAQRACVWIAPGRNRARTRGRVGCGAFRASARGCAFALSRSAFPAKTCRRDNRQDSPSRPFGSADIPSDSRTSNAREIARNERYPHPHLGGGGERCRRHHSSHGRKGHVQRRMQCDCAGLPWPEWSCPLGHGQHC